MRLPDRLPPCPQARCVAPAAVCVRLEHPGQPVAARSFFLGPPGRTSAAATAGAFQTADPRETREPEVAAGAEERRCRDSDSDDDGDRSKRRKEKKRKRKKRKRKRKKEKKAKHKRRRRSESAEESSLSS